MSPEGDKEKRIFLLAKFSTIENKKRFKEAFKKNIIDITDLYCFLFYVKKIRGFGRTIRDVVKDWFHYTLTNKIEEYVSNNSNGYKWSFKDILKEFHIKPKNKKEEELFNKYMYEVFLEREETLFELLEYYENLKGIYFPNSRILLHYENLITKKVRILKTNKKILNIVNFDLVGNVQNSKIKASEFVKHMVAGFDRYCPKKDDYDVIILWSDKRNMHINTDKKVIKINLNVSKMTNKKEEDNTYKILGFNNKTLELLANILGDKI